MKRQHEIEDYKENVETIGEIVNVKQFCTVQILDKRNHVILDVPAECLARNAVK